MSSLLDPPLDHPATTPEPARRSGSVVGTPVSVEFDAVAKTFGRGSDARPILANIDLTVEAGTITALLGASGCGKSTLLRIAGGIDTPTAGQVRIDGGPTQVFDRRCAVAFQEARLLPWRSVRGNVALGLPRGAPLAAVDPYLDLVGLADFAGHRPREISGGMAQRVSLARALARQPGVLLLDEPFGALDALTRLRMQDLLLDVHRARPTTVLLVTHDVDEAIRIADRVVILGRPDDRLPATVLRHTPVDDELRADAVAAQRLREELLDCLGVRAG